MNKLIRNIRTLLVCSMAAVEAYALNPGDLALTRVTPTGVTVLALVDVEAGERILFTDQTWTFRGFVPNRDQEGEGIYIWEVPERPPSGGGTSNPDGSNVVAEGVGLAKGEQAEIEFPEGTIVIDWRDQLFLLSGVAEQVAIPRFPGFIYGIFTDQDWHLWTSPPRGLSNDISNIAIGAIKDAPLSSAGQPRINHVIKSEILETLSGELDHLGWLRKISEIGSWTWTENNPPKRGRRNHHDHSNHRPGRIFFSPLFCPRSQCLGHGCPSPPLRQCGRYLGVPQHGHHDFRILSARTSVFRHF